MAQKKRPPQARDRALGAQLRSIRREQTSLSLEAAAALLQWSAPTMSRMETGKRHITAEDVATILATYRVPVEQRNALVARAKEIDDSGWWSRPLPGVPDNTSALASLEVEAHMITDWSINVIPGLLQTYEYARAYMRADGVSQDDFENRWLVRMRRQQELPKLDYTAYIGEAALRTPFGGRAFLGQLQHLLDATTRGIGVRVVPAHRPTPHLLQCWMLLEFPDSPPIVHVELLRSVVYLYREETDAYFEQRAVLRKMALSAAESRDMLRKVIQQMKGSR